MPDASPGSTSSIAWARSRTGPGRAAISAICRAAVRVTVVDHLRGTARDGSTSSACPLFEAYHHGDLRYGSCEECAWATLPMASSRPPQPGDTVAVWGAGGVGQMAARGALLLGAERVIVIDRFQERLTQVEQVIGAETMNYETSEVTAETEHLATHVMPLAEGPDGYAMFKEKTDRSVRAVFRP